MFKKILVLFVISVVSWSQSSYARKAMLEGTVRNENGTALFIEEDKI